MSAREKLATVLENAAGKMRGGGRPHRLQSTGATLEFGNSRLSKGFPFSEYAALVTKGRTKMAILEKLHLVAVNDHDLLDAVGEAEEKFDRDNGVGIMTEMVDYSKHVALAKLRALRQAYKSKFVSTDRDLVITDFTWRIGGVYLNKPRDERGVRAMMEVYEAAASIGAPISNEGWVARYEPEADTFLLYRFETDMGYFGDNIFSGKSRAQFQKSLEEHMETASGGLDFASLLINKRIVLKPTKQKEGKVSKQNGISIRMERFNGGFVKDEPVVVEPLSQEEKIQYQVTVLQSAVAGMLPFLDAFKVGIVPKEFDFNLNDYLYLDGSEFAETNRIRDLDTYQRKIGEWKRSVMFSDNLSFIVLKLKGELDEARLVSRRTTSGHADLLDLASHSADLYIYAAQIANVLGMRMTENLFPGQKSVTFEELEERLKDHPNYKGFLANPPRYKEIMEALEKKVSSLQRHRSAASPNSEIIGKVTQDIANLAVIMIIASGHHIQPILVGKHDRNIRKYPHDLFVRQNLQILSKMTIEEANQIIRNLWDQQLDRDILMTHIIEYEKSKSGN